ncbi:MAG: HAD family hydrolase [Myxococcota bacterium]
MIAGLVFDLDGTLIDSNAIKSRAFFDLVRREDPSGETVREILQRRPRGDRFEITRSLAKALAAKGALDPADNPQERARRWAEEYSSRCESQLAVCPEIPGASSILERLARRGIPAFISSGTPSAALRRIVELRGLAGRVRGVYGEPPDKLTNLREIGRSLEAAPEALVLVGDGEDDRLAARAHGCRFVAVTGGERDPFAPPLGPVLQRGIRDLRELEPILCELEGDCHVGRVDPA